jgi:LmbE family N-acetylglucosaminyl deacetylase
MRLLLRMIVLLSLTGAAGSVPAPAPEKVKGEDARYKADILVVVAHPDDEAFFTPYVARAIYDLHKRVAVIFSTRGGSGVNRYSRERGPAMANEREIEAREACAKLNISNVWFLDGKDTASQEVLDSLSSWGHGATLERLVGLIRLTRPEVIFTQFPGVFIGENHGDHQATGVLVTEAFDTAGDPLVFPSQLAGPTKHYELYLSNLGLWQPKKLYFASDAEDQKQFEGSGPTYSVREISPSQKKPYWRLALDSAMSHRTQFPEEIARISQMSDAELDKMMNDPKSAWWSEPSTLIFGKSVVGGKPTDGVFENVDEKPREDAIFHSGAMNAADESGELPRMELAGPWRFYSKFYPAHGLDHLPVAKAPEIGIKTGSMLVVPLIVLHGFTKELPVKLAVTVPEGWKVSHGGGPYILPAEASTFLSVLVETPTLTAGQLKNGVPQDVTVRAETEGKSIGEVKVRVLLRESALPQ